MADLTAAINLIPNRYGRLEQPNLLPFESLRTRTAIVAERAGKLNLLPTRPPGSPGAVTGAATQGAGLRPSYSNTARCARSCLPRVTAPACRRSIS